MIKAGFKYNR